MISDIEWAVEVFVRGFAFTRSFTHPYLVERHGPVWRLADAPRRRADYRREGFVALDVEPAEVDRVARARARGHFAVCAIRRAGQADGPIRTGYKALGYRLQTTEPFMAHRLRRGRYDSELIVTISLVVLVAAVTVVFGLVAAVITGLILSMGLFLAVMNRSLIRSVQTAATRGSRRV